VRPVLFFFFFFYPRPRRRRRRRRRSGFFDMYLLLPLTTLRMTLLFIMKDYFDI
jgi:hypothetical protein